MRQLIGEFNAVDKNRHSVTISVIQESFMDANGVMVDHRKVYTVNGEDGEEILSTDDPKICLTKDGSWLKKVGPTKTNDL